MAGDITYMLRGFVYRAPFSVQEIQRILDIRATMTDSSLKRHMGLTNIKSGPGGIADIDFIAQSYAAHYGGEKPALQKRETKAILSELASERIINGHDAATLTELHTFLDDVEKAIRIISGKALNTLPESGVGIMRISRMLGFNNVRRFNNRLSDVCHVTREYHERMMKELLDRAESGSSQ